MGFALILGFFAIYRIIGFVTAFLVPNFIPYLGFFPYKADLDVYPEPDWVTGWASFDGIHYMTIAGLGYSQYEEAYFPLYSLIIHYVAPFFHKDYLIAGLVVSNVAFVLGLWLFSKYAATIFKEKAKIIWTVVFLLVFPTSFFFGAVYTEGLFLLTAIGYLYFISKKKYALASVFGFFAALTRLVGVFLIISFIVEIIVQHWQKIASPQHKTKIPVYRQLTGSIMATLGELAKKPVKALPFFTPMIGLLTYMTYLAVRTGDPFYFISTQPIFGANRSTHIILLPQVIYRYIRIFITADHNFQFYGAIIEFCMFSFVFCLLVWELWKLWHRRFDEDVPVRLGLNLFSIANIMLPTLTGTLTSTPRYALFSLSIYFILAEIKYIPLKVVLAVIFAAFHLLLLGLFIQGYFIG